MISYPDGSYRPIIHRKQPRENQEHSLCQPVFLPADIQIASDIFYHFKYARVASSSPLAFEAACTPQCPTKHFELAQVDASSPDGATAMSEPADVAQERAPEASQYRMLYSRTDQFK